MDKYQVYRDMETRTNGDFYIGVVGPVRTGKSTFIRRFMEQLVLPAMDPAQQAEVRDQLPLSGEGRLITTVEPKFIPKEAADITLTQEQKIRIRLIDCVGFLVPDAAGHVEDGKERMVHTPWFTQAIPFHEAARVGTKKVIGEHSTVGLLVTTDGSFGEIPRENFIEAEEQTAAELMKQGKPFLILVNAQKPRSQETQKLVKELEEKYRVSAIAVNCEQLHMDEITEILKKLLYEFPVSEVRFFVPKWVEMLPMEHPVKAKLLESIRGFMQRVSRIGDITRESVTLPDEHLQDTYLESRSLSDGVASVRLSFLDSCYYEMLSSLSGIPMESEYDLVRTMKELADMRSEYIQVQSALQDVRGSGYGVVVPKLEEIELEEPAVIRQGNKFGVKIKSKSPSIHMIRANIETEIAPIVGTEEQAKDLITYINTCGERGESIWDTSIFGKSIEQLVQDGIRTKLTAIGEESQEKLQNTMQKIVNDSKGGMICIII